MIRETFSGLGAMMDYYFRVRLELSSARAIEVKTADESITRVNGSHITKSILESKNAFVGDVRLFISYYYENQRGPKGRRPIARIPHDCLEEIFHTKFRHDRSYGQLARHFAKRIREGEHLPGRLAYESNICNIANDMAKEAARYYVQNGYITYPEKSYKVITESYPDGR